MCYHVITPWLVLWWIEGGGGRLESDFGGGSASAILCSMRLASAKFQNPRNSLHKTFVTLPSKRMLDRGGEVCKPADMPKRPRDTNQLAKRIVDLATRVVEPEPTSTEAQKFARSGGLKGGPARAAKLSPERRSEIARLAAAKRWSKQK